MKSNVIIPCGTSKECVHVKEKLKRKTRTLVHDNFEKDKLKMLSPS